MPPTLMLILMLARVCAGWHAAAAPHSAAPRCSVSMLPPNGKLTDGFLVIGYEEKAEAEKALGVTISSDESLWEENEFVQYQDGGDWTQQSIERVVLLVTYLILNSIGRLRVRMGQYGMAEYVDLPWGAQDQNKWVVHGYVNARSRVVRSTDGQSIGQWFLQTLEPESSAELLKYEMMPGNGGSLVASFTRQ